MRRPPLRAVLHNFFTRIFLSFWAVIVLIAASVAAVTAIDFAATPDRPANVIRAARDTLDRDGLQGLKVWLAERNRSRPKQRTLIIDSHGQEILGQKLPEFFRRPLPGFGRGGPGGPGREFDGPPPDADSGRSESTRQPGEPPPPLAIGATGRGINSFSGYSAPTDAGCHRFCAARTARFIA